MSGYAASARLQGGSTRFMPISRSAAQERPACRAVADPARSGTPARPGIDLPGPPVGARIAAHLDDLREAWAQTTFYLFSPESWR